MKKKYLLLLMPFFSVALQAQTFSCAVPHESYEKELQRVERLATLKKSAGFHRPAATAITYVAVKMQLFGLDDGTGYASPDNVNDALAELNKKFKPVGIEFYFSGTTFNYYPNTLFYNGDMTGDEDDAFRATNAVDNAINLYVAKTVKVGTTGVGGYAFITPQDQFYNRIWVYLDGLNDNKTTPHEMGHYFGLQHTFNNSDSNDLNERELVTRNFNEKAPRLPANCETEGDYVCDTPSDAYNVVDVSVTDCVYTGTAKDRNGDLFSPSLSNIMNYYFCAPYDFSNGQEQRMTEGALLVTNARDFTLDAPATPQAPPSNITVYNSNDVYVGNTVIEWKDNSTVETGFIIEQSTSPQGPFVAIGGVRANATSFTFTDAVPNTTYYFRVKPSNTKATYSPVSSAIKTPILCGNVSGQTCGLNDNPDDASTRIEDFVLATEGKTLINNVASGCSQNGITNYYNTFSSEISPGEVLNFIVRSKASSKGIVYGAFVKIYADWNMDGDFNDDGELVFSELKSRWFEVEDSFIVPARLPIGEFRLRVMYSGIESIPSPCEVNVGEIEDYKLINKTLGLSENSYESVKIYPNPVTSVLNIQLPGVLVINNITVTDVTGKKVINQYNTDKQVNVQGFAAGMYIIQITSGNQKFVQKFIKQ